MIAQSIPNAVDSPPQKRDALEIISLLARWFVGGCFVYMGLVKAMDPFKFLELVRQYGVVANPLLLNLIGALLPWFEVLCGIFLLMGIAVRGAALLLIGMLVPFTILVFQRALALAAEKHAPFCAIKFDCGCGNGEVLICGKLIENGGLILVSGWLLFARTSRLCLRFQLFPGQAAVDPSA